MSVITLANSALPPDYALARAAAESIGLALEVQVQDGGMQKVVVRRAGDDWSMPDQVIAFGRDASFVAKRAEKALAEIAPQIERQVAEAQDEHVATMMLRLHEDDIAAIADAVVAKMRARRAKA